MRMKISGFTYIRNGLQYFYPFLEAIQSVLPIVDELVVVVGDSTDGTRNAILELNSDKVKIVDTIWDMNLRVGGKIFAQQANIGLAATTGDWAIHIQADEVFHEKDTARLKAYILQYDKNPRVEGLLFPFLNFHGDYDHINTGRKSERFEIRAFRNNAVIRAYRDSQGFRRYTSHEAYEKGERGKKLHVIKLDVPVYHYPFVRPPEIMKNKIETFMSFYHDDVSMASQRDYIQEFDYNEVHTLSAFKGTHPAVMLPVIQKKNWTFVYDPTLADISLRYRILNKIEALTGYRIGEYKNYKII
jgi:glycosyltransferase involved in cell wall biosynthesis